MNKNKKDAILCTAATGLYLFSAVLLAKDGHPLGSMGCLFLAWIGIREILDYIRRYREGRDE